MKPLIIVCALGRTGYKIYSLLKQQGARVIGMSRFHLTNTPDDHIIVGELNSPQTLIKAKIQTASTLVLASNDDALNLSILTQARILNPQIRIVNRLCNTTLGERLDHTLPNHFTMSVSSLAAPIFAFAALGNKAIGHLRLFEQTWPLHEEIITADHPWLSLKLEQLWDNRNRMLIYYLPAKGEIDLVSAVIEGKELQIGDHLIVATKPSQTNKTRISIQKWFKALFNFNKYKSYIRPVVVVSTVLLITIFIATFTYVFVNWDVSAVDALYFSVGMITGCLLYTSEAADDDYTV